MSKQTNMTKYIKANHWHFEKCICLATLSQSPVYMSPPEVPSCWTHPHISHTPLTFPLQYRFHIDSWHWGKRRVSPHVWWFSTLCHVLGFWSSQNPRHNKANQLRTIFTAICDPLNKEYYGISCFCRKDTAVKNKKQAWHDLAHTLRIRIVVLA